ncbi:MAG TPA: hypothetical protein P5228_01020 [Bacteroidales bacterium]|nr:hypothetical protein [Bacteroidales bacterium]HRZ49304.1 hypothetical protein [Bacteroidales bacterium]
MRKKTLIITTIIGLLAVAAITVLFIRRPQKLHSESSGYRIPKVLIITTGKDGTGVLPEGVLLAMESFIRRGAYTRVNTRDALLDRNYLAGFDILLLLTAAEYHDADRQYSLTFFDDLELDILRRWVENGGVLVGGDNIGRNLRSGADRISIFGRLEQENWPLSDCFGVMMSERNMGGFALYGDIDTNLRGELLPVLGEGTWILVPDSITSDSVKVLASWSNDSLEFPALVMNHYGRGTAFLLPSSYLLHPSNEGGVWNPVQIDAFCGMVLEACNRYRPAIVTLLPWPEGMPAAFAVSLNSDGNIEDYRRTFGLLEKNRISPTLFVNGEMDPEIKKYLVKIPHQLQSNGWRKIDMQGLSFSETVFQVEMNEQAWDKSFSGFRFPFTLNSFKGMDFLQRKGYSYESSIGIDHTTTFYGSLFPYYLPVYQDDNYRALNLLEIGPVARDDYYYFRSIQEEKLVDPAVLQQNALLFREYLLRFWRETTLPSGGMMVYLGHPLFTGHSETTLQPLQSLMDTVKYDGGWITTMEEIAGRWRLLDQVSLYLSDNGKNRYELRVEMPDGTKIKDLSVGLPGKPSGVDARTGSCKVKERNGKWIIVFDASPGQEISFLM